MGKNGQISTLRKQKSCSVEKFRKFRFIRPSGSELIPFESPNFEYYYLFLKRLNLVTNTENMAERRQRTLDLSRAGVPQKEIAGLLEVSVSCVHRTVHRPEVARKPGSGGHNKKRTPTFIAVSGAGLKGTPRNQ